MRSLVTLLGLALLAGVPVLTAAADPPANAKSSGRETDTVMLLTDFKDPELNDQWQPVNDNVMGGRSLGEISFESDHETGEAWMQMSGRINTNGGGFTSARMWIDPAVIRDVAFLDDGTSVRLRVRLGEGAQGRPFALRLEDDVRRSRSINFRAVLPLDPDAEAGAWQTVSVRLSELAPTHNGNRLDPSRWAPLDPSRVVRIGVMLNDTHDGPYRFDVGRIELVPKHVASPMSGPEQP